MRRPCRTTPTAAAMPRHTHSDMPGWSWHRAPVGHVSAALSGSPRLIRINPGGQRLLQRFRAPGPRHAPAALRKTRRKRSRDQAHVPDLLTFCFFFLAAGCTELHILTVVSVSRCGLLGVGGTGVRLLLWKAA